MRIIPESKVAENIKKHIDKAMAKEPQLAKYLGRRILNSYVTEATDGRRLLAMRSKDSQGEPLPILADFAKYKHKAIANDPTLKHALKRMAIITKEDSQKWVKITFNGSMMLESKTEGFEGQEELQYAGQEDSSFTINPHFLIPAADCTLKVLWKDENSPICFMPESENWIYVVMPMKV